MNTIQKHMLRQLPFEPSDITKFMKYDLWRFQTKSMPPPKAILIKFVRILFLCVEGFRKDKCYLHASALTFFSLISIVPVLAMVFGIAKGFGFEKLLENELYEKFPGQTEVLSQGIEFAKNLITNTKGGALAGIGLILLIWSVIKVLGHIESSFNEIWEITKSRSLIRKFTDYISIVIICPLLFTLSNSLTIIIKTQIEHVIQKFIILGIFTPFIFVGFKLVPFILIWTLFTAIYMFMTNTKVKFSSALTAGVVSGTAFQIFQWGLIEFQVGVARYNGIYGSFAAIPLFLFWLQFSWIIMMIGSEIAFAHQHIDEYEFAPDAASINTAYKNKLSLFATKICVTDFQKGNTPLTASEISTKSGIPIRLCRKILKELAVSKILSETRDNSTDELVYQPAKDIHSLTIKYILDAINTCGTASLPVPETEFLKKITEAVEKMDHAIENSDGNLLLCDI